MLTKFFEHACWAMGYGFFCFSLFGISSHFTHTSSQAILMFPTGLFLSMLLCVRKHNRPTILLTHIITIWLILDMGQETFAALPPLITIALLGYFFVEYHQRINTTKSILHQASLIIICISLMSWAITGIYGELNSIGALSLLAPLTAFVLLFPAVYLIRNFLASNQWVPHAPNRTNSPSSRIETRQILLFVILFSSSIAIQLFLPLDLERLRLILIQIPLIFFAYRFGWQGAAIVSILNAILLSVSEFYSGITINATDTMLSMLFQSLLG